MATFDEPFVFELPVSLHHGVRVYGHLSDHLFDRGQLVTDVQRPHPDGLPDLLCQLQIRGHTGVRAQLKADRLPQYFSSHL